MDFFDYLYEQSPPRGRTRIPRMSKASYLPKLTVQPKPSRFEPFRSVGSLPRTFESYFDALGARPPYRAVIASTRTVFSFQQDSSTIVSEVYARLRYERYNCEYVNSLERHARNQVISDIQRIQDVESSESSFDSLFECDQVSELTPFLELDLKEITLPERPREHFDIENLKANELYTQSAVTVISRIIDAGRSAVFAKLLHMDMPGFWNDSASEQ